MCFFAAVYEDVREEKEEIEPDKSWVKPPNRQLWSPYPPHSKQETVRFDICGVIVNGKWPPQRECLASLAIAPAHVKQMPERSRPQARNRAPGAESCSQRTIGGPRSSTNGFAKEGGGLDPAKTRGAHESVEVAGQGCLGFEALLTVKTKADASWRENVTWVRRRFRDLGNSQLFFLQNAIGKKKSISEKKGRNKKIHLQGDRPVRVDKVGREILDRLWIIA